MEDNPYVTHKPKLKKHKHNKQKERSVSPLRVEREIIINKVYKPVLTSSITPLRYRNTSPNQLHYPNASLQRIRVENSSNNFSFLIGSSKLYPNTQVTPSLDSTALKDLYGNNLLPQIKQKKGTFKFGKKHKKKRLSP